MWRGTAGDSYIGQWSEGKASGFGVHIWENKDKYEGEWLNNLRHGNGSDFFHNGDQYVGQYKLGKPHGFGQYKWANGSTYTGSFKDGFKQGQGKWQRRPKANGSQKGNAYEGQYANDKKHGVGYFVWESGNTYAGNYKNDERSGYGVMRWTDGSVYMGIWDRGIQSGIGVMVFPDKHTRAGFFEDNVFKKPLLQLREIDPYRKKLSKECVKVMEDFVLKRSSVPQGKHEGRSKPIENEDDDLPSPVRRLNASEMAVQTEIDMNTFNKFKRDPNLDDSSTHSKTVKAQQDHI